MSTVEAVVPMSGAWTEWLLQFTAVLWVAWDGPQKEVGRAHPLNI
jgi:hypothetical protein